MADQSLKNFCNQLVYNIFANRRADKHMQEQSVAQSISTHNNQNQLSFVELVPSDYEQFMAMMKQSYFVNNPRFINNIADPGSEWEEAKINLQKFQEAKNTINQELSTNTIFCRVFKNNGKIVASILNCEINQYFKYFYSETNCPFNILLKKIIHIPHQRGKVFYSGKLIVHKDQMGKGLASKILQENNRYMAQQGYEYSYLLVSNEKVLQLTLKRGGVIIDVQKETKGQISVPIYLVKMNFIQSQKASINKI